MKTDKTADNTDNEDIIMSEECVRARKTAVNILSYSDNTELRLREKLAAKGFSREAADDAVRYVISRGWLDEQKQVESALRYLAEVKLFGRRRILQELRKRGFRRTVIDSCDFNSCDFAGNCRRLWKSAEIQTMNELWHILSAQATAEMIFARQGVCQRIINSGNYKISDKGLIQNE